MMESATTRLEPVKATPFLPMQITTMALGGTGKVLSTAAGLVGTPLLHLTGVFSHAIICCDIHRFEIFK